MPVGQSTHSWSRWVRLCRFSAVLALICAACGGSSREAREFEWVIESPLLLDQAFEVQFDDFERHIDDCMREQGFDYALLNAIDVGVVPEPIEPDISPEDFVERYGRAIRLGNLDDHPQANLDNDGVGQPA